MPTTQPLTQPVPPPTSYSSSISSQIPNYSTLNSISGVNNAILGVNNSGSGNNNLINGENNCLTGDSNVLVGGNNLVSGSSNTILGSQNCVTGSSNTVLPLPSNMQTSPSLAMGSNVITSGTLPPPPTTSLIWFVFQYRSCKFTLTSLLMDFFFLNGIWFKHYIFYITANEDLRIIFEQYYLL